MSFLSTASTTTIFSSPLLLIGCGGKPNSSIVFFLDFQTDVFDTTIGSDEVEAVPSEPQEYFTFSQHGDYQITLVLTRIHGTALVKDRFHSIVIGCNRDTAITFSLASINDSEWRTMPLGQSGATYVTLTTRGAVPEEPDFDFMVTVHGSGDGDTLDDWEIGLIAAGGGVLILVISVAIFLVVWIYWRFSNGGYDTLN